MTIRISTQPTVDSYNGLTKDAGYTMASSVMDDQEILKLKKISGKKRRSRNSFSSSTSLLSDHLEVNRLLDGENTMVYALVEVSRDSDKPAKREKIPLNNKDLFLMMQKFMNSKKEKFDRKILRPSLKRKYGLEYADSNAKFLQPQKPLELGSQNAPDKTNISYEYSNHSTIERAKNRERNTNHRKMHSGDNEFRISNQDSHNLDLKILYNRNTELQEQNHKHKRNTSLSRGTNTDIVQTPKVLEEVLQSLNTNFDFSYSGRMSEIGSEDSGSDRRKTIPDTLEHCEKRENACKQANGQKPIQNLLLVPFIITSKHVGVCKKSNSCESVSNEEKKCSNCSHFAEFKCQQQETLNCVKNYKSVTNLQASLNPVNIRLNSVHGLKIDYSLKNGLICENEKQAVPCAPEENREQLMNEGKLFLEEVKILQMKLNAIIRGFEMSNLAFCYHKCNPKCDINSASDCLTSPEDCRNSSDSFIARSNQSEKITAVLDEMLDETLEPQEEASRSQDFSVQVALTTSSSDSTLTKTVMLDKPSQFPSEEQVDRLEKITRRRLVLSKSTPLYPINGEYRTIKTKRTASLISVSKIKMTDFLCLKNLSHEFEGSRPDNGDQSEEKEMARLSDEQKTKEEPEKTTDILFKKKSTTKADEKDKCGLVMLRPGGKIAKIKIVGSTTLGKESQETGTGNIKLALDETSSIKITNKFTKKVKTSINSGKTTVTEANNVSEESKCKTDQEIKKSSVKPEMSKIARKEPVQKQTKPCAAPGKVTDADPVCKTSKLRKPTVPIRCVPKGKDAESDSGGGKSPRGLVKPARPNSSNAERGTHVEKSPEKREEVSLLGKKMSVTPNEIKNSPSSESAKTVIHKTGTETANEPPQQDDLTKHSQAVKSIWALTKVILYKDGSQSFEVLEASSSPPGYHLSKKKESTDDPPTSMPCITSSNNKINYNDNSDINSSSTKEKSR